MMRILDAFGKTLLEPRKRWRNILNSLDHRPMNALGDDTEADVEPTSMTGVAIV